MTHVMMTRQGRLRNDTEAKSCHFLRWEIMGEGGGWQRVKRESKVVPFTCLKCLLVIQVIR